MTKKILDGVNSVSNWTSIAGALQGTLMHLGERFDEQEIMGLTGHAFRLAIRTGEDGIADSAGTVSLDYGRAIQLYAGLGHKFEHFSARPADRGYDRRREEAIKRIQRSIDRGVPAIVYDLQLPEFGLVKGYDDRAGLIYVSTTVSSQYGEALPLRQWPAPGRLGWIEVIVLGDRQRFDRRRAEQEALCFAVDYAERGEPCGPDDTVHGLAAYERWLEGYTLQGGLSRHGNARCIQIVLSARRDAARFLRAIAGSYEPGAGAALDQAAAAYDAEALAFSRMATLFPFPSGGDVENLGALMAGAASLRQALEHERRAIDLLKAALEQGMPGKN